MPLPLAVAELLAPRAVPLPLQVGVDGTPAGPALPTGIGTLDALAAGGLPRGRLTEVVGRRGAGATTLLRRLVEHTAAGGGWVAVIDASRTLAPRDWAAAAESGRVWVVRPEDATRGAWCADVLLRSGAFSLVVLDSAPPLTRAVAVRLTRLARESGAALVVAGVESGGGTQLAGAMRLRVGRAATGARHAKRDALNADRATSETAHAASVHALSALRALRIAPADGSTQEESPHRQIAVLVEKGGIHRTVEVSCALVVSRRLCAHPEVPDRRGVARRATGRGAGRGGDARPERAAGAGAGAGGSGEWGVGRGEERAPRHPTPDVPPPSWRRDTALLTRGRRRNPSAGLRAGFATPDFPPPPGGRTRALG